MKVGLLGANLRNNFTVQAAEEFGLKDYEYKEVTEKQLRDFVDAKDFEMINITFPYKRLIMEHCDYVSDHAKEIGAVDTIFVKDGKTYGHNTDYHAFEYMLSKHEIDLKDKKVLIIGNGGTSRSVQLYAKHMGAREIHVVDIKESPGSISYIECFSRHLDSDIVINTSPVGMSPDIGNAPIDMGLFSNCEACVDVIFNPILTKLGFEAQENDIKRIIGIEMLAAQVKAAAELYFDKEISSEKLDDVIHNLLVKNCNVVLIGMPSAGKTTIGKMVAERLGKEFIDMDNEIVNVTNMKVPEIFAHSGEAGFRKLETMIACRLSTRNNIVIGTGGGTIKNKINMDYLRLNGIIFFIDRDLDKLISDDPNRPLSSSKAAVKKMYRERYPIYQKYATKIVSNNEEIEDTVEKIIKAYHKIAVDAVNEETANYRW